MSVQSLFDLQGKTAIVTGGGSGIGRQMAGALAEAGASLMLCARKVDRCEAAAAELSRDHGVRAIAMQCDVRDPEQVNAVVERTTAELGSLDILLNNAGTSWSAPMLEHPLEGWQKVLDVNLTGVFLFAQAAGRVMVPQGRGKIVNIASVAGLRGAAAGAMDTIGYSASKGGVVSFTRDLAVKWAPHGITVNAIAPGWFPTDMSKALLERSGDEITARIPLGRFGGPEDLKGVALLLSSAASDFITGQTFVVDGGQSAW